MGQYILIVLAAAILSGSVIAYNARRDTGAADSKLEQYQYRLLARDAAVTGLQYQIRQLADEKGPWTGSLGISETSYNDASFYSSVRPLNADTVDVRVVGVKPYIRPIGGRGDTTVVINARFKRSYSDGGVPPAFRNAITTDLFLLITGNFHVDSYSCGVLCFPPGNNGAGIGFTDPSQHFASTCTCQENATIHSNEQLKTAGNSFTVHGYGSYTGSVDSKQTDNFTPHADWNGDLENAFPEDSVRIPIINFDGMTPHLFIQGTDFPVNGTDLAAAGITTYDQWAQQVVPGYTGGTIGGPDNPFILLVEDGNLELLNRVELAGYAILGAYCKTNCADPDVGNIRISPSGGGKWNEGYFGTMTANYETMTLIATTGNIDIESNPQITASMYATGYVDFKGTPRIFGGIVAKEASFNGGGTPEIWYGSASQTIIDPGFEYQVPVGPILIAYSEF